MIAIYYRGKIDISQENLRRSFPRKCSFYFLFNAKSWPFLYNGLKYLSRNLKFNHFLKDSYAI
jgi:hypothetical protein